MKRNHPLNGAPFPGGALPWERSRAPLYRTIFPQMTLFPPEEEGAQFRLEFEVQLARLAS
jgi:hypothetical protein